MGKFSGKWPKRHLLLGNQREFIEALGRRGGYLSAREKEQLPGSPLAVKKNGKYSGNRTLLRESQNLASNCVQFSDYREAF